MKNLIPFIGKVIPNDGQAINAHFGQETKHVGNFNFTAEINGRPVTIITTPVDEDMELIKIVDIQ